MHKFLMFIVDYWPVALIGGAILAYAWWTTHCPRSYFGILLTLFNLAPILQSLTWRPA